MARSGKVAAESRNEAVDFRNGGGDWSRSSFLPARAPLHPLMDQMSEPSGRQLSLRRGLARGGSALAVRFVAGSLVAGSLVVGGLVACNGVLGIEDARVGCAGSVCSS